METVASIAPFYRRPIREMIKAAARAAHAKRGDIIGKKGEETGEESGETSGEKEKP